MNKAIVMGHVGQDPEIHTFTNGEKVATLNVATNRKWKNKDGQTAEDTDWHKVRFYGRVADVCEQWVEKGSKVLVEGRMKARAYDDKDGQKKYDHYIHGENLELITFKQQTA